MLSTLSFASSKRLIFLIIATALFSCKTDPPHVVTTNDVKAVKPHKTLEAPSTSKETAKTNTEKNTITTTLSTTLSDTKESSKSIVKEEPKKTKPKAPSDKVGKAVVKSEPAPKPKKAFKTVVKKPNIKFEQIRYDFGAITQGDTVDYKFKFSNEGKAPLVITNAKATCGCTQPSFPFMPIEPGETGYIGVRYVSVGKEGAQKPLITVTTNASKEPIALMLNGMVNLPEKAKEEEKVAMVVDSVAQKKDTLK